MADLKDSVRREINQLKRNIARTGAQLASLKSELRRRQRIQLLLVGERPRTRRARRRRRTRATVDWNSVLKGLRRTFTLNHLARRTGVRKKPRAYLRQVVVRWAKQGKIKRTGRGRYQKV